MNEYVLIAAAGLLLISVLVSKISDRFGVPALLLFLGLGMLAGSDGPGGIYFDNPAIAQFVGVIALVLILFSGGLDTDFKQVRAVLKEGILLSTLGVLITALITGWICIFLLDLPPLVGLLLGAIVSSTDAAAVFSVLRSKGISLKGNLKPLLELESGSNDPMAIFLTIGLIQLIQSPEQSALSLISSFFLQMLLGGVIGVVMGRLMGWLINHIRLGYEGLYPVLSLALVFLTFGVTSILGGSGFLAVYVTGIVLGNREFIHRRSLLRFHDGLAWLMQIAMFLTLGLLVFPSRLPAVAGSGLLIAAGLMFLSRPLGVLLSLIGSRFSLPEKVFVSWVGLRGAVPIILATFPLLAQIPQAELIFNIVFFVVLTSVLLQGTTITPAARWLKLDAPALPKRIYPIEYTPVGGFKSELKELAVPPNSPMAGKAIVELGLPDDFLVVLIARQNDFVMPSGGTVIQPGDTLLALADSKTFDEVCRRLCPPS
ncbi:potassium/proton antiporter [Bellilinea caldifistulae]|uniref:Potassium transporter n=1 Tax=Bellilinea caldifistulae TaxID=360411 RepID=A0A0P6Y489_9CHLR|nr:potassium/proton antiporter [Bellilinea caldifistulae]KPL76428.1 potassium transporter [Bellilinea caldifistulae]